jgi:hypothetical protein
MHSQGVNIPEGSIKANNRLRRIKIASRCFRILIALNVAIPGILLTSVYFGWIVIGPHSHIRLRFSSHQMYGLSALFQHEIPANVLALAGVRFGLFVFCVLVLNNLFRLYERGIFFSAKNVNYLRFLGYYLIIDWLAASQLEGFALDGAIVFTQLFCGLFIIFIAWIMDEGRKIQEEQELTV